MKTISILLTYKITFILFFLIFPFIFAHSQNQDTSFYQTVDSVLLKKPIKYSELDTIFKHSTKDTIKMSYLVHKSLNSGYKEGACFGLNSLGAFFRNISHYEDYNNARIPTFASRYGFKNTRIIIAFSSISSHYFLPFPNKNSHRV